MKTKIKELILKQRKLVSILNEEMKLCDRLDHGQQWNIVNARLEEIENFIKSLEELL